MTGIRNSHYGQISRLVAPAVPQIAPKSTAGATSLLRRGSESRHNENCWAGIRESARYLALSAMCSLALLAAGCLGPRNPMSAEMPDPADIPEPLMTAADALPDDPAELPEPAEKAAVEAIPEGYVLSAGDQVSLDVFREPDLSGTFLLESSGVIRHPLFGSVEIAGLSLADAEARITKLLAERYLVNPRVMIRVASSQSHRIVMLGEVRKPGVLPMPFDKPMTLLQAVAEAGGFTDLASVNRVKIVRSANGGQQEMRVRVSRIIDGRDPDILLEPNDIITVPQSFF